ncbi:GGDEF domain-containing protein [Sphingomonas aquatilis NBRC 16722]|uniref:Diguanylate cyclase (GGDEF)-like protein/PAS domain S-box-containing protein n=1 Tax=Sphingomonas aquatilis TaxID=93063 RepID=A0AAW3TT58_9SPHN|nr:GGDEF and EAL domain-containing protein [Sphingomonas aquatilis]MBB3875777.1 diguanylate cyclase (GGDEF)-like protein/PAS domain S-box-containing protein [Sphingomonas aquatilis]GEM72152.1 GGDEF domain-containing protein [Sphingomonas aquatilis NBRC 16722]
MTVAPLQTLDSETIGFAQLLGLTDGADAAQWARIRSKQLDAGRHLALFLLAANLIGAALVVPLFAGNEPLTYLIGWAALVGIVAVAVAIRRLSTHHRDGGYASARDVRTTLWEGVALAVVWAVPVFAFRVDPGSHGTYALWMILALLMTAGAMAMAPLALATIAFLGGLGAAVSLRTALDGSPTGAAATALFTVMLIVICLHRARALVVIRAVQIALAERNDTVSLLLREFEETAADWLWETDAGKQIVKASPRFAYACGLDPIAINGQSFLRVLAGPAWDTGHFSDALRELAAKMKARESFRDLRIPVEVNGEQRWWQVSASPRFDEKGSFCGFRGVGSDVTEQCMSADRIARMARFDTLTGLPNRLMINETLAQAMAEAERNGQRCSFMMIDLDRFKAVNDTLGHPIGDRLLARVSARLAQLMDASTVCGRLGGDEFAVVVRDATRIDAVEALARRIIDTLSQPYEIDAHTLYIGASVGLAIGPRDGRTAEMLIRSADLALYRAKDAGRGVYHAYEPELHVQAEERRVLEMALRQAVERNELHLQYQPVVDAGNGRLTGFEALLRWRHPELGLISPEKFVPLAEESRLIGPIGEWVVRTACAEAAQWPSTVRIAVNVSPDQLQNPQFVSVVASALANSRLPPERLELEVTESVFLHEGLGTTKVLEQLLSLGIRLSLDDFGTGYSSLGYLSRTRFSSIKIDRSFVQGASSGVKEAVAIIRAVVALAQSLGMATTAEGVETEEEHRLVQELGCTKVQGFFFSRPLSVEDARALVARSWNASAAA